MTVFSYSDLRLIIDGTEYTAKYLSNVTISKSAGGIGTSGVSTTCLSGNVKRDFPLNAAAVIEVRYKDWQFPTYYVDNSDFNGSYVSLTAYDLCKDLDLPFDRSAYPEPPEPEEETEDIFEDENNGVGSGNTGGVEDETEISGFPTSQVISDIANQIGFNGCYNVSGKTYLEYEDLDGSYRSVLQKLSEADCGVWYCTNDNKLNFVSFGNISSEGYTGYGMYSKAILQVKKTFTKIFAEDTKNNKSYEFGSGDWKTTLMLSGEFLDNEMAANIASRLFENGGKLTYQAFNIDHAIISSNIEVMGQISVQGSETAAQYYTCTDILITFGAVEAAADLSAAKTTENKVTYADKINRKLQEKVQKKTVYENFFIDENGAGIKVKL